MLILLPPSVRSPWNVSSPSVGLINMTSYYVVVTSSYFLPSCGRCRCSWPSCPTSGKDTSLSLSTMGKIGPPPPSFCSFYSNLVMNIPEITAIPCSGGKLCRFCPDRDCDKVVSMFRPLFHSQISSFRRFNQGAGTDTVNILANN